MVNLRKEILKQWGHLANNNLFVACSGGLDSTILLFCLKSLFPNVKAIHVNYQVRGEESDGDEAFIRSFCAEHAIPLEVRSVDLKAQLKNGGNLQQKARDIRYDWFKKILSYNNNNRILLGHHLDDQIETFYLNLARKSGVMGMACMLPEHHGIVRPFLTFSKKELENFAIQQGVKWRNDSSNASLDYSRNKLRSEFIPGLMIEIPSLRSSVLLLIKVFQTYQLELEETIANLRKSILANNSISSSDFNTLDEFEKIELFRSLGISASLLTETTNLTAKGTFVLLDKKSPFNKITKEADGFTFVPREANIRIPELFIEKCTLLPDQFSKDVLYLDAQKVKGKITLRKWEIGDRITPVGMNGTTLISDVIKDAKLTYSEKQNIYVVSDEQHILWCVGLKISRYALANTSTSEILKVSVTFPTPQ